MAIGLGGGKTKKPLSVADKEAKKRAKELLKKAQAKETKEAKERRVSVEISDQLIKRAHKVVSEAKVTTPSSLASSLGVRLSVARALIRELVRSGSVSLVSKYRGLMIVKPPTKS